MNRTALFFCSIISFILTIPCKCLAFTAPAAGDPGFQVYDFVTKNVMNGAIGIVICIGMLAAAAFWVAKSNIWGALACFIAAILFYSAEDIALAIGVMF